MGGGFSELMAQSINVICRIGMMYMARGPLVIGKIGGRREKDLRNIARYIGNFANYNFFRSIHFILLNFDRLGSLRNGRKETLANDRKL
jgi:hypothetical protein